MSSLPPLTSRQLSELRDTAQKNLVNQLCDALMDSSTKGTVKDKIKEPLATMMIDIMQNPENMVRLSDSVHHAIHKSLEKSLKGPLLLYSLMTSEDGFEEVKKHIYALFTQAYGEKATIRAFRGKLYTILQNPQSSVLGTQRGGKKKTHRKRQKVATKTRKLRHIKGGNNEIKAMLPDEIIPDTIIPEAVVPESIIPESIIPEAEAMAAEQLTGNEQAKDEKEKTSVESAQATLPSTQYDLREYNDALLDEMKKNIQEVGEQMTSKMIEALSVTVKSNADTIVKYIVSSVGKTIEKDDMIKKSAPVIIVQALRAASTDLDKAVISTFDEIQSKDPEAAFVPIQSSFMTTFMQHLKLRLSKQVTGQ